MEEKEKAGAWVWISVSCKATEPVGDTLDLDSRGKMEDMPLG